jgi:acetyl coenzyme A synthetase (ADP forming)-like protein
VTSPPATLGDLLCPRSVAVVGASRRPDSIGGAVFKNLLANEFQGPVYPVNPKAEFVHSVRAFPSLDAIPGPVDLAILTVPRDSVLAAVKDCAAKGVRGLVVITAGFREIGPEGRRLEDEVAQVVRGAGMRMIGPNCLGILNTDPAVSLDATFAPTWPLAGRVAFSSQSGALGLAILDLARELGLGISTFASIGNKADVSGNDLIEYWEKDPNTDVILLYLESFGNPRRFTQIARRVARTKPILAVKSGRTGSGRRAAQSHTGALAGADLAVDALFHQAGVVRTDTIDELFDAALLLAHQPLPAGNRVAILTNAGGPGIMAADACEGAGLVLPTLDPLTDAELRTFLAPEASTRNPVDMIASARAPHFERGLGILLRDPNIDSVLVIFVPPIGTEAPDVARAILAGAHGSTKPVLTCFMGTHGIPEGLRSLRSGHVPSYAFPEAAAHALGRAVGYARWRARPESEVPKFADADPARARRALAAAGAGAEPVWLGPLAVSEVLAAYGLKGVPERVVHGADDAAAAAQAMGFPVAIKLVSTTITHKSDVGGVILRLADADAVRGAYTELERRLSALGKGREFEGALVQRMVTAAYEGAVGMTLDPQFGPLLMAGLGGTLLEVHKDVAFRLHPLTCHDAAEMVDSLRSRRLFDGYRAAPAADLPAFLETILRVSHLVGDLPEIVELDLNPVAVLAPGEGAVVVDARIRVGTISPRA